MKKEYESGQSPQAQGEPTKRFDTRKELSDKLTDGENMMLIHNDIINRDFLTATYRMDQLDESVDKSPIYAKLAMEFADYANRFNEGSKAYDLANQLSDTYAAKSGYFSGKNSA